jgi:hypothetical protein
MTSTPVSDTPVADTLLAMTGASIEQCALSDHDVMVARISALAASGASAPSYLFNAGPAAETGLTLEDAQGILVAVAPIIGTVRTVAAATEMTRALGLALALVDDADGDGS